MYLGQAEDSFTSYVSLQLYITVTIISRNVDECIIIKTL